MWWGYSEALDLQEELEALETNQNGDKVSENASSEELNVLLIGHGDARHILKTISKAYTHPKKQVNFYVIEPTPELYARQMLLLTTALEPPESLGLLEKARTFMELYGNTLLRPNTLAYLSRTCAHLIHVATSLGTTVTSQLVRLDKLRYKERDLLEQVFHFWKNCAGAFDIPKLWDERIRRNLGVRYDSRVGAFDWDYHMRLHPLGGAVVNKQEYMYFRQCGVAFTWLETECSKPNPTLASGILKVGDRLVHHGYIGDTHMGPYAPYGLDCEDQDMLKATQGCYLKRSTDITERNLMRMMSEIEKREKYVHRKTDFDEENLGVVITEISELNVDAADDVTLRSREVSKPIEVEGVRVTLLPTDSLRRMERMTINYAGLFDVVSVAQYLDSHVDNALLRLAKDGALLLVEGKLFVLGLRKDDVLKSDKEFTDRISGKCERLKEFDPLKDTIARFRVVHSTPTPSV